LYLLDTNIVSELRRPRPHGGVVAWLKTIDERNLYVCAVTLGEIQAGIEKMRTTDPEKAAELDAWADSIPTLLDVLPMDHLNFRTWAKLMFRKSTSLAADAMIAATALQHNLTVVTRNIKDFESFGVKLLDPFRAR
jgi:predicted nucleic acid-binding protein